MSKVKGRATKDPVDEAPKSAYPAYPETMMANSLLKEGMDDRVVEALLTKGHCKVAGLVVLSGMTNRDLANMTNLHELALKNRRNIEFIRTALVKLRIDIPPPHPSFLASMDASSAAVSAPPPPSQQQLKPSPPTAMPQPAPPSESKGSGGTLPTDKPDPVSEHDRMLDALKEFPVAYEQYIKDNGGLAKPSSSTVLSTKPEDELQDAGFLCGAIPTTSLWTALAEALGFFGLGSDQKEFQSVDQIVGEFCTSTGLPTIKGPFHPKARSKGKAKAKKKLSPLEPNAAPTLPPLQLVPTDWTARDSAGVHLRNESRRLFKIFSGITRGEGIPTFNWEFKLTKSRVTVHQAMVPDSPWAAIKSDCIIHADKDRIRKLITDDLRSHEYDPSVETYEVRLETIHPCFSGCLGAFLPTADGRPLLLLLLLLSSSDSAPS